jgi:hypothetical protein
MAAALASAAHGQVRPSICACEMQLNAQVRPAIQRTSVSVRLWRLAVCDAPQHTARLWDGYTSLFHFWKVAGLQVYSFFFEHKRISFYIQSLATLWPTPRMCAPASP